MMGTLVIKGLMIFIKELIFYGPSHHGWNKNCQPIWGENHSAVFFQKDVSNKIQIFKI